jgi:hypothetical protein
MDSSSVEWRAALKRAAQKPAVLRAVGKVSFLRAQGGTLTPRLEVTQGYWAWKTIVKKQDFLSAFSL